MGKRIVIIGGVTGGPTVATRARRLDPEAEITIIEQGAVTSYGRCGLPFYLAGQVKDVEQLLTTTYGVVRNEEYFRREKGVNVLTRTRVTSINRKEKEVSVVNLSTGQQYSIPYDKLVLATGSAPVVPSIEGINLKGIYYLSHPDDGRNIANELDDVSEAVIIGGGAVGLEVAGALIKRRILVSVIELKEQILPGILDPNLALVLVKRLEDQGVEFYLGEKVLRLEDDGLGRVGQVVTNKRSLDTQLVIMAVGVHPNVELASAAGLAIGETGAVAVNEYLQTSDPDVYALGDCAESIHLISARKMYIPLATNSTRQGRVVGSNLAGRCESFRGTLGTSVLKILDFNVGRTGLGEEQAKENGFKVATTIIAAYDRAHYYPDSKLMLMKLIAEDRSRRILGAQAIGLGDVVKRIDVLSCAIRFGATIDDLAELDLGFAPPFGMPLDPVHNLANTMRNKEDGLAEGINAKELKEKMVRGDDFVLLDVYPYPQQGARRIIDERLKEIPIGELRERIGELPKDKEIIILCPLGARSYNALRILAGAGFTKVKFLEGGLQAWPYDD